MGSHTDFAGEFGCTPTLSQAHAGYLRQFSRTRSMKRDPALAATLPDPLREAVGLSIGDEGAYFVGGLGLRGQDADPSVTDHNTPPGQLSYGGVENEFRDRYEERQRRIEAGECQPGLWCQWIPSDDGTAIEWDGGEKFYEYVAGSGI